VADTNNFDEGVIKFNANDFKRQPMKSSHQLTQLNDIRSRLFRMNLIGEYPIEKVGFGNLSIRYAYPTSQNLNSFIISGTQTGHIAQLGNQDYTYVIDYNFEKNSVAVRGPVQASSESLTHGAIYQCHSDIQAVIHVHSQAIWQGMLDDNLPHTSAHIPYGTPEMAEAVQTVINGQSSGVLAMAGHEDGVITFAETVEHAFTLCEQLYRRYI